MPSISSEATDVIRLFAIYAGASDDQLRRALAEHGITDEATLKAAGVRTAQPAPNSAPAAAADALEAPAQPSPQAAAPNSAPASTPAAEAQPEGPSPTAAAAAAKVVSGPQPRVRTPAEQARMSVLDVLTARAKVFDANVTAREAKAAAEVNAQVTAISNVVLTPEVDTLLAFLTSQFRAENPKTPLTETHMMGPLTMVTAAPLGFYVGKLELPNQLPRELFVFQHAIGEATLGTLAPHLDAFMPLDGEEAMHVKPDAVKEAIDDHVKTAFDKGRLPLEVFGTASFLRCVRAP